MIRKVLFLAGLLLAAHTVACGQSASNSEGVTLPSGSSWEAEHFREALQKGRSYQQYYVLVNDDKKVIEKEDLIKFCNAHDYLYMSDVETKEVKRFGDMTTSVYKFKFMPMDAFGRYVFEWADRDGKNSSQLKSSGNVYFFYPEANKFSRLEGKALWTGNVVDGCVDGSGAGILRSGTYFYYFSGTFRKGFPVGKVKYRVIDTRVSGWPASPRDKVGRNYGAGAPIREVELGEMSDGMALFRYLDSGEGSYAKVNNAYGYVNQSGVVVIKPTYSEAHPFKNGRAAVKNDKGEDIYINKSGQFVDYTEGQKRQQRAEQARKDSIAAAQERERLAAERRAAEERRQAEAKEADLQKRINANKDPKKWHRGDRMCYRFGTSNDFVLATLEEWNSDRSKIKVKIVASPSNLMKLNGESLTKNNTMWVSVRGEGWHLALDEEVKIATQNDRSDDDHICSACNGRGTVPCSRCNGTGVYEYTSTFLWTSSTERERCTRCNGKGSTSCYSCGGSGRR